MGEGFAEVEKVLKAMEGKDVNIYQCGKVCSYRMYPNFQYWYEECISGDFIVLSSSDSEVRFSILADEIYSVKIDEDKNEIKMVLNEMGDIQIWLDLAS